MAAVLTLQEMADKAGLLLGIDPTFSLVQKVAKANTIAGVEPNGDLKQQVDNIEKLIRKAAFITRELGIPPGLSMNQSINAAFAAVQSQPAGSSLFSLLQQLQRITGIGRHAPKRKAACLPAVSAAPCVRRRTLSAKEELPSYCACRDESGSSFDSYRLEIRGSAASQKCVISIKFDVMSKK